MESPSGADVVAEDAEDETAARGMELESVLGRLAQASRPVTVYLTSN